MTNAILWALTGTGFTFLMTTLGAAMVFFFKKQVSANIQKIFLGFAAGVMIAASVWSLLIPAMEEAEAAGTPGWLPAAGGFILGIAFLMLLDSLLPHLHPGAQVAEGISSNWKRTTMLMLAVTLHNIPEGMAVGLAFALAAQHSQQAGYTAALALALGLSDVIQNYAGGVELDVLFVDEGFGTLDAESLEQAVTTLHSLVQGQRMVGIISHVPELKSRIENQLVVTKTPGGSTVALRKL